MSARDSSWLAAATGLLIASCAAFAADEPAGAEAANSDLSVAVRAIPEVHHAHPASPYAPADAITGQGDDRLVDQVELRGHGGGFSLVWTGSAVAERNSAQNSAPAYAGTLNEAYHESEWHGVHGSIGKKAMSWDVGLAFRPLDVVQQEDRRALYTFALDGIPVIA
ncbi:MAG TPA: hypothetical protein VF229_04500, partial [Burkholderiaceae bacterium]